MTIRNLIVAVAAVLALSPYGRAAQTPAGKTPKIMERPGPEAPRTIKVRRGSDSVDVEVRVARLETSFTNGKSREDAILVLREPRSGLVWWDFQQLDPKTQESRQDQVDALLSRYRFGLREDRLVGFQLFGKRLIVREGREKKGDFTAALQSIKKSLESLSDVNDIPVKGRSEVSLLAPLSMNFFWGTKFTAQGRPSKLVDAVWSAGNWTLRLEGPDGEPAEVILGEDYAVKKATRNGKVVFPSVKAEEKK